MISSLELAFRTRSCVGEGPLWDEKSQCLLWVDVLEGKVFTYDPNSQLNVELEIGKHVGAIALTHSDKIMVAARDEIVSIDLNTSSITPILKVIIDEKFRFNDGRVDARGRFVVGSMGYEPQPGTASLYSYTYPQEVETILANVGLSNGLSWSADSRFFYHIDTLTSQIAKHSYDLETGKVSDRKPLITFEKSEGSPDGMTIDREGNLWVAFWGGGCIRRISPEGKIIGVFKLPISRVTSVAFGGENLSQLYITTASYLLNDDELLREPLAGSLFVMATDTQGFPEHRINLHS
jgi:sugar lactone lactonase YvrE